MMFYRVFSSGNEFCRYRSGSGGIWLANRKPARTLPLVEMDFDQVVERNDWPDMDQSVEATDEAWN